MHVSAAVKVAATISRRANRRSRSFVEGKETSGGSHHARQDAPFCHPTHGGQVLAHATRRQRSHHMQASSPVAFDPCRADQTGADAKNPCDQADQPKGRYDPSEDRHCRSDEDENNKNAPVYL